MTSLSRNARIAGLLYVFASAIGFVRLIYILGESSDAPENLTVVGLWSDPGCLCL
jgi:hypothetical protein